MSGHYEYLCGSIEYQLEYAVKCGNNLALLEALDRYSKSSRATPFWLPDRARKLILKLLTAPRTRRGLIQEIKSSVIHLSRYEQVEEIREKQAELKKRVAEMKENPRTPADLLRYRRAQLKAAGSSWEDAYSRASRLLSKSAIKGSPSAMIDSFKRVNRAGGYCGMYYPPYAPCLADLGLSHLGRSTESAAHFETLLFDGYPPKQRKKPHYQKGVLYGKEAEAHRQQMQRKLEAQKTDRQASETKPQASESKPQAPPPKLSLREALNISFADRLEFAVKHNSIFALLDGLDFQRQCENEAAPEWLLKKALQTIVVLLTAGGKSRGRKGNPLAMAWAELTDVQRFWQVLEIRWQQKMYEETYTMLKHCRHPDDRKRILYWKEQHRHYGKGIRQAARLAAGELAYTPWPGRPEAVEKSCRKVLRDPELIAHAWQPSPSLSRELGFPNVFDFGPPPRQEPPCPWEDDGDEDFDVHSRLRRNASGREKNLRAPRRLAASQPKNRQNPELP